MNPTTPITPTAPVAEGDEESKTAEKAATDTAGAKDAAEERPETAGRLDKARAEPADRGDGADQDLGLDLDDDLDDDGSGKESAGLGTAAAAVVSVGLGIVSLTGAWSGRVAAERETLIGQIKTSSGGSAAQQISEIYGDAWHATALVNGIFGLVALLVGCYVLVRPAFGAPSAHPQAGWVRAVAKGGIALGVIGVLVSVGMYFDLIVALPTAAATTAGS
uniref:Integral membrane protein n=1 Tax=Streptomyces sp. NBC_00008 TaxID=2903610 RepID=A0AAU2VLX3_9ACTN